MFSELGPFAFFKWQALFSEISLFLKGFRYTFLIVMGALPLALLIGFLFGIILNSHLWFLKKLIKIYVGFVKNTPLLIQVLFLFNCLPLLGVTLKVTIIGIVGVGLYHAAYMTEVIKNGISSVDKGQFEAAKASGFNFISSMRHIIIPQAMHFATPPLTTQAVTLIKNTSVVSIISGVDIMFVANSWSGDNLYYGPAFVLTGILYFIMCFPLTYFSRKLEKRLK